MACGILVPQPGLKAPGPHCWCSAVTPWTGAARLLCLEWVAISSSRLNHWTTRKFPSSHLLHINWVSWNTIYREWGWNVRKRRKLNAKNNLRSFVCKTLERATKWNCDCLHYLMGFLWFSFQKVGVIDINVRDNFVVLFLSTFLR